MDARIRAARRQDAAALVELRIRYLADMARLEPRYELLPDVRERTEHLLPVWMDQEERVLLVAEVCLREGVLEVLLCKKNTKEHEAILRTDVDARFIHAALVAAGARPGSPVRFLNPQTDEPDYRPASGSRINVHVHYRRADRPFTHPAQDWIIDLKTKKPMAHHWVFAGSRFLKDPDNPTAQPYYAANNGEVISLSNFVDSMLDVPVASSREEVNLLYRTNTEKIPPRMSGVYVILERVEKK